MFLPEETPLVIFSKDSELHGGTIVQGSSKTYKATDLCFLNGVFIDPGYIHDVLLTDLEPSTTYYYSCGVEGVSRSFADAQQLCLHLVQSLYRVYETYG